MRVSIIVLMFFLFIGSPVSAMDKMSTNELKKATAQIATAAGLSSEGSFPAQLISTLIEGYNVAGDLQTITSPVSVAQTPAEPVITVTQIIGDANAFKSGVTFGFL